MNWRSRANLTVLGFGFLLTVSGGIAAEKNLFLDRLNTFSHDIHFSEQAAQELSVSQDQKTAAFSKESASLDELKKLISSVGTQEDAKKDLEVLRQFGYRMNTTAEKRAFQQAVALLESRLKFLSQGENPEILPSLDALEQVSSEIEKKTARAQRLAGDRPSDSLALDRKPAAGRAKTPAKPAARSRVGPSGLLGAVVENGRTCFSVYSPDATAMNLHLFESAKSQSLSVSPMKKGGDGVWRAEILGELYGKFYGFMADGPQGPGFLFDSKRLLSDPYALANVDHDGKSIVVKTDFTWTDQGFKPPASKDLVVYEMHVKDYTAHASADVAAGVKGKYLGLLEGKGTDKVLGNLIELGVNAVELLPCQEFDNNFAGHLNHWGYMTSHYFAPESSFASGKNGEAVKEFKQMVNGLHKAGIAVIMDVVYNHTAEGNEKGNPLNFKGLDNAGYYRLMDDRKFYWNGTGCGNEFRSDNPMTRKYILDSLKYWVRECHVDGFRFDLGTILDKETMNSIINDLPADVVLLSEPWAADWKRNQWSKTDFRNTKLAKWNDDYRENIRSFIRGTGDRNNVMTVIAGSCFWWAAKPSESLNYLECHDGAVLSDLPGGDKKRLKLGAVALLTSQGIPMIHEGQEFMKSKKGNDNSYDQDNDINWINWSVKKTNADFFDFFSGLVHLRTKYDNFRHGTALNNQSITWIQPPNQHSLGYLLKGEKDFLVLLNADSNEWINFQLPGANDWTVVCNGDKVDIAKGLGTAKGDYKVPPLSGVILKNCP